MIFVHAEIKLKPGSIEQFTEVFNEIAPQVHQEPGCISYELSTDRAVEQLQLVPRENMVTVVEKWESATILKPGQHRRMIQQHFIRL